MVAATVDDADGGKQQQQDLDRDGPVHMPRLQSQEAANVTTDSDSPQRIVLCLVADAEVIDRFPAATRYIQVGLIDEAIDVILVTPDHPRAMTLASGPTRLIQYERQPWPLCCLARRALVSEVGRTIDSIHQNATVIVHCLTLSAAPLAAAIASAFGAEFVLNVASRTALDDRRLMRWIKAASNLVTPAAAIHNAIRESHLAFKTADIVPLGVVNDQEPAAFNDPEIDPTIIFAGSLTEDAGIDVLLRAVRQILRVHPTLKLFVLGRGPHDTSLRHLTDSLGISANVTFTGRIEHMRAAMRAADIFCMPRVLPRFREEPIHALASGLAVILAEGVYCDGLTHQQTALLVPDGDEDALIEGISNLVSDRERARAMAAKGQAHAREHHSVSRMVSNYVRIYRNIATRHDTLRFPGDH